MRKELIDLVEGRLRDTKTVLTSNAKGPTGMPYPTRSIYILAEKYIREHLRKKDTPSPRWLVVPGLRGVGKSTLLAQLYVAFSNNSNVIPLYFAMDDVVNLLKSNLQEVLEVYQQLTGTNLATVQKTVLIFLDEVHYDPSWSSVLKVIYDKNPNIFIFCTGLRPLRFRQIQMPFGASLLRDFIPCPLRSSSSFARRSIRLEVSKISSKCCSGNQNQQRTCIAD
jgi:hypothetical protein